MLRKPQVDKMWITCCPKIWNCQKCVGRN